MKCAFIPPQKYLFNVKYTNAEYVPYKRRIAEGGIPEVFAEVLLPCPRWHYFSIALSTSNAQAMVAGKALSSSDLQRKRKKPV
jgi:hypothetical protein